MTCSPRLTPALTAALVALVALTLAGCAATGSGPTAMSGPGPTAQASSEATEPALVDVAGGRLLGYTDRGVHTFRGIRYAQAERFRPAERVPEWDGVRPALVYGPTCPAGANDSVSLTEFVNFSGGNLPQNEDCLCANVWTPSLDPGAAIPVIVWVHGGAYSTGASNELEFYDGRNLAATGEAVFVSVNHRLNVLGYTDLSAYGEEYAGSGNLGQLDLVAALRWVEANIEQFGGDPQSVTVVGQSGGGGKVLTLLGMPAAEGLIDRAVVMSAVTMWRSQADAQAQTASLLDEAGVASPAGLVELSYLELLAAAERAGLDAAPVVDGDTFPEESFDADGAFTDLAEDVPLIVTTVLGEFASNLGAMSYVIQDPQDPLAAAYLPGLDEDRVDEMIAQRFGDHAEAITDAFATAYPGHPVADVLWMEDGRFFGSTRVAVAAAKAAQGGAPVYGAVFAQDLPVFGGVTPPHTGGDIPFLFRNHALMGHIVAGQEAEFAAMSQAASDALLAFAATGDPGAAALPWPAYTAERATMMVFDTESQAREQHEVELYRLFAEARGGR